ncbi:hypothetical protein LguiA_001168 [Lonicera macranthoides]
MASSESFFTFGVTLTKAILENMIKNPRLQHYPMANACLMYRATSADYTSCTF